MAEHDEVYGEARIRALRGMLRDLADRIVELDLRDRLLEHVPELIRRMGDLRSELFHYEVRITYDSPEIAEHRRLVGEAQEAPDFTTHDPDDHEPWRQPPEA